MALDTPILFLATAEPVASLRFYRDVLGLPLLYENESALVFRVGELMLRIQKTEYVAVAPYTSLGWRVANIQDEMSRLRARGVVFERYDGLDQDAEGVWRLPNGPSVAWFKDPDGNTLSISQHV